MFNLTYNKAILIQRSQLAWYRPFIGLSGTRKIRSRTKPCPPDIHPDEPISIFLINKLVPRGGSIEQYIRPVNPSDKDELRMSVSSAIEKGFI